MKKAFTLVELMIVVSILGILGAIVLPMFQNHIQQAKEAAAKDNLRILRNAINIYAAQHNDVQPGYSQNNPIGNTGSSYFYRQLTVFEHHLNEIPENPFTGLSNAKVLKNIDTIPSEADATPTTGWIYQPFTKTIKLNYPGTDTAGIKYYDY